MYFSFQDINWHYLTKMPHPHISKMGAAMQKLSTYSESVDQIHVISAQMLLAPNYVYTSDYWPIHWKRKETLEPLPPAPPIVQPVAFVSPMTISQLSYQMLCLKNLLLVLTRDIIKQKVRHLVSLLLKC